MSNTQLEFRCYHEIGVLQTENQIKVTLRKEEVCLVQFRWFTCGFFIFDPNKHHKYIKPKWIGVGSVQLDRWFFISAQFSIGFPQPLYVIIELNVFHYNCL